MPLRVPMLYRIEFKLDEEDAMSVDPNHVQLVSADHPTLKAMKSGATPRHRLCGAKCFFESEGCVQEDGTQAAALYVFCPRCNRRLMEGEFDLC